MSKEMIVSVNGREKKIAILDNGKVTEFYIERGEENSGVAGNVYKGRVMRVLPGMQSAFVDIGLDRDAFLYVSDFFDEEAEIERIVMEKGKKASPEDVKREAQERIDRSRAEREKQMEAAQEVAEPLVETPIDEILPPTKDEQPKRGRGRGKKAVDEEKAGDEEKLIVSQVVEDMPVFEFDIDNPGFERISDDDTGEMFKDAFVQEAIVDKVRSVEFAMESVGAAEVGSLIDDAGRETSPFERIADEDEDPPPARKTRGGRAAKGKTDSKPKRPAAKKTTSRKSSKAKDEASDDGTLENAEASLRERDEIGQMAVRRGGRGRKRGGAKPRAKGQTDDTLEVVDAEDASGDQILELPDLNGDTVRSEADDGSQEQADQTVPDDEPQSGERSDRDSRRGRRGRSRDRQNGNGRRPERDRDRRERPPVPAISDLLREGQEILVQIAKEPIAKKGARITSHIALPGRYLVYMPTIEHLGVSRKIESSNERGRLRQLIQRIRQDPEITAGGFIVRTAGIGISEEDLRNDAKYLVRTWKEARKASEKKKAPSLVHRDLDLVQRILRDQFSDDFTAVRVDSEEEYLRTVEFINLIQPRSVNRIKLYTRDEPILDYYGVQEEVDKALKPRVWLKSGGYLVINQTEALVAIDVNTGKFVGKGNARLEDTITRTNMEAVEEIARQIRLRDLGGIIVLDLIDMEDRRNRHKVSQALQAALADDRSPTKVLSFNDFGLIIMTRKRVKQSLERTMCSPCDNCEGAGWVKSPTTVCYEILTEARRISKTEHDIRHTTLRVHPDVAKALRSTERSVMDEIEAYLGNVDIAADKAIHQGQFDFAFV